MIFSLKKIDVKITSSIILGFNEPDHSKQSNLSVEEALENWHKLVSKSQIVGAPAMAGNPINGEWFPKFMESNFTQEKRYELILTFNKIRKEFRNEKILILFILNFIFLSSDVSLENISFM